MAWIELHDGIWEHHRIIRLCDLLGIQDVTAIGHLSSLWHFALRNSADHGDLSPWGDPGIEKSARWIGDKGKFIYALRECGLLEGSKIHDWDDFTLHYHASQERAERNREKVRERVAAHRERKRNAKGNDSVTKCNADTIPSVPNQPNQPNQQFEIFWKVWRIKKAKADAEKAFNKLNPDDSLLAKMVDAVEKQEEYRDECRIKNVFYPAMAMAGTWIRGRRWEDQVGDSEEPITSPKPAGADGFELTKILKAQSQEQDRMLEEERKAKEQGVF